MTILHYMTLPLHHTLPLQDTHTSEEKEENKTNIHADFAACPTNIYTDCAAFQAIHPSY